MEQERKSAASRTVSIKGFQELTNAVNRLADAIEKPDEAKKWQIVAWKALCQLGALSEFVKSSIADLEKLDIKDELSEHNEGWLLASDFSVPAFTMGTIIFRVLEEHF